MDKKELYWNYYLEQRETARFFDQQRASIASYVIIVSGALFAFCANKNFSVLTIPISIFIIFLGCYGALVTRKLYERSELNVLRAQKCLAEIDCLFQDKILDNVRISSDSIHNERFVFARKIRLYVAWMFLHGTISLLGIACVLLAVMK